MRSIKHELRALVVGADSPSTLGRKLMLEVDGYEVIRASDLADLSGLIRARRPDLIFVDGLDPDVGRVKDMVRRRFPRRLLPVLPAVARAAAPALARTPP
jgi:CheY-like chemotaxis protein